MSPAGNNNGLNSREFDKTIDDTEPVSPILIPYSNEVLESSRYQKFIEAINKIQGDTVYENPDAYTRLLENFITSEFIALSMEALPREFEILKEKKQGKKDMFASTLKEYIEGHDGVTQLAGVIISMTLDQDKDFFKNPNVFALLSSLVTQHLSEIISDNLNEEGLLSENILEHFGKVLLSKFEDTTVCLNNAAKDFFKELGGKRLSAVFKVSRIKQAILEIFIERRIGRDLNFQLVPALLYINLYASKKAYDTMEKYSKEQGIIGQIAQRGMQSLVERYTSQIELKHSSSLDPEQILQIRTKEILTNYTYALKFLAFAVGNKQFRERAEQFNYENDVQPGVENSGRYIRLSNDLGGLLLQNTEQIGSKFDDLASKAKLLNRPKPLYKIRQDFLKLLYAQDLETQRLFYTYIKDLGTNENNAALDSVSQDVLTMSEFINQLKAKTIQFSTIAHVTLEVLQFTDPLFFPVLDNFRKFCEKLYERGADFDTADAKKVISEIINEIKQEGDLPIYVEA